MYTICVNSQLLPIVERPMGRNISYVILFYLTCVFCSFDKHIDICAIMPDIYQHRLYYGHFLSENINLHDEAQFAISSEPTCVFISATQYVCYSVILYGTGQIVQPTCAQKSIINNIPSHGPCFDTSSINNMTFSCKSWTWTSVEKLNLQNICKMPSTY